MLTVENSQAMHGHAVRHTPERRSFAHQLTPPRRAWTMGQTVDRRFTVVIDVAFLGLALFLVGRLIRAVEAVDRAVALGVLALALVVALATGQLRRLNGRA